MGKIYPVTTTIPISKKDNDEIYGSLNTFVWCMCLCVCICVGIIVLLTQIIERKIYDGSEKE